LLPAHEREARARWSLLVAVETANGLVVGHGWGCVIVFALVA
jgi:hypothetical protein